MITAKIIFKGNRNYYNHYRPMIKIREDDMYNSCELIFINKERVSSEEEVKVNIIFLAKEYVANYLQVGKSFLLYEGLNIVGEGEIISV